MKITISEKEKRKVAWLKATSSSYFEGITPTDAMNLIANRFISGEFDINGAVNQMMQHLDNIKQD
jgi:hypothetical protein